ncbi:Echinoderm microtubule-associated protein-like 6 [Amphibalanus amphitrite]|uniref:Echinoderm microtubule-associated protein-like 6 n=1 Tax=Amphibalanus amphitrite TaxID=1232801 RepID=A0A6A4VJA8_AMPAM|nr:Echinoderm microtubule-associated protein-like 6 [Amphibalanus amphitrite]
MQGHGKGELWGLAPFPEHYKFATAGEDHTVRIWDVEKRELLETTRLDLAAMSCAVSPDSTQVAVGLKFGTVVILNAKDMSEEVRFADRREDISELKFSPDGSLLAVGSHDSIVDVYRTDEYVRTAVMQGASSYITHLDWSTDGRYVEINTGAGERLTYRAAGGVRD